MMESIIIIMDLRFYLHSFVYYYEFGQKSTQSKRMTSSSFRTIDNIFAISMIMKSKRKKKKKTFEFHGKRKRNPICDMYLMMMKTLIFFFFFFHGIQYYCSGFVESSKPIATMNFIFFL